MFRGLRREVDHLTIRCWVGDNSPLSAILYQKPPKYTCDNKIIVLQA